jgi:excisionase family DNA binding protein
MIEQNQPVHDDSPTAPFIPRLNPSESSRTPSQQIPWNADVASPSASPAARTGARLAGHDLLDGAELARRMNVGRTTVWRLAKHGHIPYFVMGRRWMFEESEVLEALRVRQTRSGGARGR